MIIKSHSDQSRIILACCSTWACSAMSKTAVYLRKELLLIDNRIGKNEKGRKKPRARLCLARGLKQTLFVTDNIKFASSFSNWMRLPSD